MQASELELITQSLQQDADAYGQLVDRYKSAIYRHCFAIVRDEEAAQDIAQETFIAAYYKLNSFDTSRKFSTWLFKIATNGALDYLRKGKHTVPLDDELALKIQSSNASTEKHAEYSELYRAIATLEPKYRAVIHLYYFEGMDYSEIAESLSRPTGSIKGWMSRARQQLRKEII